MHSHFHTFNHHPYSAWPMQRSNGWVVGSGWGLGLTQEEVPLCVQVGLVGQAAAHHVEAVVVAGPQPRQPAAVRAEQHLSQRSAARRRQVHLGRNNKDFLIIIYWSRRENCCYYDWTAPNKREFECIWVSTSNRKTWMCPHFPSVINKVFYDLYLSRCSYPKRLPSDNNKTNISKLHSIKKHSNNWT